MIVINGLTEPYIDIKEAIEGSFSKSILAKLIEIKNEPEKEEPKDGIATMIYISEQLMYIKEKRQIFYDVDLKNPDTATLQFCIRGLISPTEDLKDGVIDLVFIGAIK